MSRARSYTLAAVLTAILSLANVVIALALLPQGSDKVNSASDQPPYAVIMIEVLIGAIGLVAAYGVYRKHRWAVLVTLVLMVVNLLVSLPGIPFGPTAFDKISSAIGAVIAGAVIWLLLRRDSRVAVPAEAV